MSTTATVGLVVVCATLAAGCMAPQPCAEAPSPAMTPDQAPVIVDQFIGKTVQQWAHGPIGAALGMMVMAWLNKRAKKVA